ncbi:MAG: LolA-related protein [Methylophilaceae bacterium]
MFLANVIFNRLFIVGGLALTLPFSSVCQAADWNVEILMQTLAQAKPSHATFIEKKHISLLDQPVESSGELFFTAPNYLEKRTLKPKPESLIVEGDRLLIERGSKTYYFQVQSHPELAVFINSIRNTLAGDLVSLERNFTLHLNGTAEKWMLQLSPTSEKIKAQLQHIRIAGLSNQVRSIEVSQTDGDYSYMTITPSDTRK